jgi:hypothetical protein
MSLGRFRFVPSPPSALRCGRLETAVFDKPHIKKSAFMGTESFPQGFFENLRSFSRREFPAFKTCDEALAWLAKD